MKGEGMEEGGFNENWKIKEVMKGCGMEERKEMI